MSLHHHIIKQRHDLLVATSGQIVKASFQVDRGAKCLVGIALTSDLEDKLYHRGTIQITFSDKELFPDGFDAKLLMSGVTVAPNQRVVKIGAIQAASGKLTVTYTDHDIPLIAFAAYRVSVYTFCTANYSSDEKVPRS